MLVQAYITTKCSAHDKSPPETRTFALEWCCFKGGECHFTRFAKRAAASQVYFQKKGWTNKKTSKSYKMIPYKCANSWLHPYELLQNVFSTKPLAATKWFYFFQYPPMMPKLAATKCDSNIGYFRKKPYKTTLGYKLQWPKVSIFPKKWLKKCFYSGLRP